jgi:hypothetical protein
MNEMVLMQWALQAFATEPYPDTRFPPSPYYRFLRVLAANLHPNLSVELGCGCAGASLGLAMGWQSGVVIGIDHANEYPECIEHVSEKLSNFRFWRGDSVGLALEAYNQFGETDILFIDTVHTYEQTWREFNAWRPFLSDRAVVCLDDLFRPGMARAWEELPGEKLRIDELHTGGEVVDGVGDGGFGVIWDI